MVGWGLDHVDKWTPPSPHQRVWSDVLWALLAVSILMLVMSFFVAPAPPTENSEEKSEKSRARYLEWFLGGPAA